MVVEVLRVLGDRFDEAGARERNAEYGRELVGLNIHIPWSA